MNQLTAATAAADAAFNRSEANRFFADATADDSIVALYPGRLLMEAEEPVLDDGDGGGVSGCGKADAAGGTPPDVRGGGPPAPPTRRSRGVTVAGAGDTALILLQGRLLDGRLFYTPPTAATPTASAPAAGAVPAGAEGGGAPPLAAAQPPTGVTEMVLPLAVTLDAAVTPACLVTAVTGMAVGGERTVYVHPDSGEGVDAFFGVAIPDGVCLVFDIELVGMEGTDAA